MVKVRSGVQLSYGHVTACESEETVKIIVTKEASSTTQVLEPDEALYVADQLYMIATRIKDRHKPKAK